MKKLSSKLTLAFIFLGLIAAIVSGIFIYFQYSSYIKDTIEGTLANTSSTITSLYDLSDLERYAELGKKNDPEYRKLLTDLNVFADSFGFAYIYGLKPDNNGNFVFILDTANLSDNEDDWSFLTTYDDAPPEIEATFKTGDTVLAAPYTDQWGRSRVYMPL